MYYRTEIDYWKRYQSYKHSLPLILQSCDVEPSHRRPSLLIPPPAIPSPFAFPPHLSLFLSVSLLAFLSIRLPIPQTSSPSSCFSHSLRRYVMECTGCPASTGCPFKSGLSTNSGSAFFLAEISDRLLSVTICRFAWHSISFKPQNKSLLIFYLWLLISTLALRAKF